MNPAIENEDFRPPPEPRLPWMIPLAIVINVLLIALVAWGIQTTRDPLHEITEAADAALDGAAMVPTAQRSTTATQARTACPLSPMLAAAGGKDGQVLPPADVQGRTEKDIDALLVAGKEAAAAGQLRDAEVDYLTSCRVADTLKGAGSIESANARYQLARHYAAVASTASALPIAQRAVILARAQAYYEDSLQRFRTELGESNEKTRFAAEGLKAAQLALARTAAQPAVASEATATARMGAAPAAADGKNAKPQPAASSARAPQRAALPKPSFDCGKARSYAERTICSDAGLAQLDRDLGRLHAKAKHAARDPAAFKRQNDAEWHRREATCRDRGCLLRWYADRRQQLTRYLGRAPTQPDRTASR
jgi:uncharacterized protein